MLIQRGLTSSRKRLLIIGVVIIAAGILYILYSTVIAGGSKNESAKTPTTALSTQKVPKFNQELFQDPNLLGLKPTTPISFIEQAQGRSTDADVPLSPEDITVSDPGVGATLYVWWTVPSGSSIAKARIYRANTQGILGEQVADLDATVTFYKDTTVQTNATYFYLIRLVNAAGAESTNTTQIQGRATDIFPPAAPTGLEVEDVGDGAHVKIRWTNPSDADFSYSRVYRSTQKGSLGALVFDKVQGEAGSIGNVEDNVGPNTHVYYTVTSVDVNNNESSKDLSTPTGRSNPFEPIIF